MKMCKVGRKQHKQTSVTSYYVTVVFDFRCESEYRFTPRIRIPIRLIEYSLRCRTRSSLVAEVCGTALVMGTPPDDDDDDDDDDLKFCNTRLPVCRITAANVGGGTL